MRMVLLSGGAGRRLWPFSNDIRSKQFLKVLTNEEGHLESMVQRVWRQLHAKNLTESTIITTNAAQSEILQNQLGEMTPIVVEPERRDTFPAIALSAAYLYSHLSAEPDESVVVLPVDPYVHLNFFDYVKQLDGVLNQTDANIALLGVKPTYPSEKYGYIVPKSIRSKNDSFFMVDTFKEKPDARTAKELINQGALWNCGVFAFKLRFLLDMLEERGFPIVYEKMINAYNQLPKISFDYEVVEKTNNVYTLEYCGQWKDLGTWNTLTEEMNTSQIGKGVMSDCENTHLINELDIPVVTMGIKDCIVATSPDGVLISKKSFSPQVKDLLFEIDQRPMFVERRWGCYKILDFFKLVDKELITRRLSINNNQNLSLHYHKHRQETWTILTGSGYLYLNGTVRDIKEGDVILIAAGDRHAIKALTNIELIEVQSGIISEDDIHRLVYDWEEIVEYDHNY